MPTSTKIRVYCGSCQRDTNHVILCRKDFGSRPDDEYCWSQSHYFCQCAGCDKICYAVNTTTEDDYFGGDESQDSAWKTYPSSKGERQSIERTYTLPNKVRVLYEEVVAATNADLSILAAVGLRSLIEAICKDRGVTGGNLSELIDGLSVNGILSTNQAAILHSHRFLGNVAAHEVQRARREEILAALEIAESMVKTIYILSKLSDEIRTGKPNAKP